MATPESKVKALVKDILKRKGAWFCMPVGGGYGRAGVPDFLVCYKGRFLTIETKAGNGKTTALQDLCMKEIEAAGGRCIVINEKNITVLSDWLEEQHE